MRTASDFTRRQPALVFGLASLAGFVLLRVLKSNPPSSRGTISAASASAEPTSREHRHSAEVADAVMYRTTAYGPAGKR